MVKQLAEAHVRIVAFGIGAFLILGGGVILFGWLLPPAREGRAETVIAAPPERVLAVIAAVEAQTAWRRGIERVTRTKEGWEEVTERGETIRFVAEEMNVERVKLRFVSDNGYTGSWVAQLSAEGDGTRIRVTERSQIRSPIGRIIARLFFDPESFATNYLAALKAQSER